MFRIIIALAVVILLLSSASCGGKTMKKETQTTGEVATVVKTGPDKFVIPTPPANIKDQQGKMNYLISNYWESVDFADSSWVQSGKTEEIFGNFIFYASHSKAQDVSSQALVKMLKYAEQHTAFYDVLIKYIDKYLYDPNSPVRNEELYIVALESQIANTLLDDVYKIVPRERLKMAMKNRVGSTAIDFSYKTSKGGRGTLNNIKADYLLIFFYNLGCPACRDVRMGLFEVMENPHIAEMMKSGRLKVLALYPDADMSEWDRYIGDIPSSWINAYDDKQEINNGELYDLRATPSLYLLDGNKQVLLKDFSDPFILTEILLKEVPKSAMLQ